MSDFPDAMTKQILSAPPRSMRSTRYSLTAQGRSAPPSSRLPTGRSSFENASGWMRLPRPAAGITPHMTSGLHRFANRWTIIRDPRERRLKRQGAAVRGVLDERPLARGRRHALQLDVGEIDRGDGVLGCPRDEDLLARHEKRIESVPPVRQDRGAASRRP